jgi:Holliday junction resolvase-like predicted endonuclease
MNPRQQIEQFKIDKYLIDINTGQCNLPEDAKTDYDNALKILSEQLYSKDIHFIFELIQNAEDNHYANSIIPELSFELLENDPTNTTGCSGCLVIRNNETGFNINNIKAISSIGRSTKANQKDAGYIGEKGIGFKSVFVVSPSPHILSNGFKIKFLKNDPKTSLGYIIPYWLNDNLKEFVKGTETTLLLPLQNKLGSEISMFNKVQNELSKLSAELILFLRNLKKLSIKTPDYYANYEVKKEGDSIELLVNSTEGQSITKYLLKSQMVLVPDEVKNDLRANVKQREISLAFPVGFEQENSKLFCYLPTESETGLPFLVNADFILSASRESIRQDLTWNGWLRDEVASFAAKSLANILSKLGDVARWAWVPVFGFNRVIFWDCVRDQINQTLQNTKCIPTVSGNNQLPESCLKLGNDFKFLLEWPLAVLNRLDQNLFGLDSIWIDKVSTSIGLNNFNESHLVKLLVLIENDDELTDEHLISALVEVTAHKGKWGDSKKYGKYLTELRSCNLFRCDSGLNNSKYKNLFLPSIDRHEVPVLVNNAGESTQPNYINTKLYCLMPVHLQTAIKTVFRISEVNAVSYLENSVVDFLKLHAEHCSESSLKELTKYLIENIDVFLTRTIELLKGALPFKCCDGTWSNSMNFTFVVAPLSHYDVPLWQKIYTSNNEIQSIFVLHDDYLNWGELETTTKFLQKFEIDDYVPPVKANMEDWPSFEKTPSSFFNKSFWQDKLNRDFAHEWLYKVYADEDEIKQQYNNNISLSYFLLNEPWLLSTSQGFVKPSPTLHCFSENERGIFGDSLNYLADAVIKTFAKKLGLVIEPTPRGFMDQIKAEKEKEVVDEKFLILAYESLSNWKDPREIERVGKRLSQDLLIYLPEPNHKWVNLDQATWEDKSELGSSFVGLAKYLPDRLKHYFVEMLDVNELHGIDSYFDAYKSVVTQNRLLTKEEVAILNNLVRKITQHIKSDEFTTSTQWNNFVSNIKVYSGAGCWLDVDSNLYVADDGKIKQLFEEQSDVHFTWTSATEFFSFFDSIGVKKASENVVVSIGEIRGLKTQIETQISVSAKSAICLYIAGNLALNDTLLDKLVCFNNTQEFNCEELTVKYSLENQTFIEVHDELGVYDSNKPGLILVNNNDLEDIKDELSLSIARFYFGKSANQHEKSIRLYLNIQSEERLQKIIKNDGLELVSDKAELLSKALKNVQQTENIVEQSLTDEAAEKFDMTFEETESVSSENVNDAKLANVNIDEISTLSQELTTEGNTAPRNTSKVQGDEPVHFESDSTQIGRENSNYVKEVNFSKGPNEQGLPQSENTGVQDNEPEHFERDSTQIGRDNSNYENEVNSSKSPNEQGFTQSKSTGVQDDKSEHFESGSTQIGRDNSNYENEVNSSKGPNKQGFPQSKNTGVQDDEPKHFERDSTQMGKVNNYIDEVSSSKLSNGHNSRRTSSDEEKTRSAPLPINNDSTLHRQVNCEYLQPDKGQDKSSKSIDSSEQSAGYRLFSYVESDDTHDRTEKAERDDQEFGYIAESFVKKWLEEKNYKNVRLLGGTNKGFDIEAVDSESGEIIYVEVKGQRSAWNRTGVALSSAQMQKCIVEGSNYWLIVVENLLTIPTIHKFIDPAKLIDRYYFDANWSKVSDRTSVVVKPSEIDIDDLIFDAGCKEIYKNILNENLKIPEIGYELSNDRFEVIAELEFAWPLQKVGVYAEEPGQIPMDWQLFSSNQVLADFSILTRPELNIKEVV